MVISGNFHPGQPVLPDVVASSTSSILIPWAIRDVDCAIGTFNDEIYCCQTAHDALILREVISDLALRFAQLESKALKRADALCGVEKES